MKTGFLCSLNLQTFRVLFGTFLLFSLSNSFAIDLELNQHPEGIKTLEQPCDDELTDKTSMELALTVDEILAEDEVNAAKRTNFLPRLRVSAASFSDANKNNNTQKSRLTAREYQKSLEKPSFLVVSGSALKKPRGPGPILRAYGTRNFVEKAAVKPISFSPDAFKRLPALKREASQVMCVAGETRNTLKLNTNAVQKWLEGMNKFKSTLERFGPCKIKAGVFAIEYQYDEKKLCCNEETFWGEKHTLKGDGIKGGVSCDFTFYGIPEVAEAGLNLTIDVGVSASGELEPVCNGEANRCLNGNGTVTIKGGPYAKAANDAIRADLSLSWAPVLQAKQCWNQRDVEPFTVKYTANKFAIGFKVTGPLGTIEGSHLIYEDYEKIEIFNESILWQ